MLHVVLHVCCMCVACVLHVRCMAGVQDRAVTLSKWCACHAERQPVHPTTLRNQVKKVSRLSLHVFHLAQPILAHMRHPHTNTRPNWSRCFLWHSVVIILAFVCSHGSILLCLFWVRVLQKKQPSHEVPHQRGHATPRPPIQCCLLNFVFGGLQKKQPFLLMMLGTSDHNIEVGGCGGKQGISVVSCGWLFFLKNPVSFFWVPSSF